MSELETQNDELNQAIRRAWDKDAAPIDLHNRAAGLTAPQSPERQPTTLRMPVSQAFTLNFTGFGGLAIAAILLVALGLVALALLNGAANSPTLADTALPGEVANSFVFRHDACCQAKDHHLIPGIDNDSLASVARRMSADLGVPVVATPIEGWLFAGAGPCPVWGHVSAHLLYRHQGQTLSVFSIPQSSLPGIANNREFDCTLNGHALAAFSRDGGLYCVVGYSADDSVSPAQVKAICNQLETKFPTVAVDPSTPRLAGVFH